MHLYTCYMALYGLALHGGAGDINKDSQQAKERLTVLQDALDAGVKILAAGGRALDAVVAAVIVLEDHELFNAGRGSVLRNNGSIRMDASLMCADSAKAGAVIGLCRVKNPIMAARKLLESEHTQIIMHGDLADIWAQEQGLATAPISYFVTQHRRDQLVLANSKVLLDYTTFEQEGQTVGAVALDVHGHLAAATSTGGLTNAHEARVGDSAILGAGTWADDQSCAVSATGDGEFFVRAALAHEVCARYKYLGETLDQSTYQALQRVKNLGGQGGCIAIDKNAQISMPFVSRGMARAAQNTHGFHICALD